MQSQPLDSPASAWPLLALHAALLHVHWSHRDSLHAGFFAAATPCPSPAQSQQLLPVHAAPTQARAHLHQHSGSPSKASTGEWPHNSPLCLHLQDLTPAPSIPAGPIDITSDGDDDSRPVSVPEAAQPERRSSRIASTGPPPTESRFKVRWAAGPGAKTFGNSGLYLSCGCWELGQEQREFSECVLPSLQPICKY